MTFNSARIVQPGKMQLILAFADKLSCGANYLFKAPLQLVQLSHPGGSQQVARGHLFLFMFVSSFFSPSSLLQLTANWSFKEAGYL